MGVLIPRVLGDLGLDAASTHIRLIRAWDVALGPELARVCRPEALRRGVVVANVPDSAWMQRVQLESPRILASLRAALGDEAPQALRLRLRS